MFIQLDLIRSITRLFHHLLRNEPSTPLILITILQMERTAHLLLLFCRKEEAGTPYESSRSYSRASSSADSSTCRNSSIPAVKSLIDALMAFFFTTLELLSSPPLLTFITPDVVKHTVHALQQLLPFGECVASEWGRVLMQCSGTSDEQVQIEILKAVRVLAGMISDEKGEDVRFIADEVVKILVESYSVAPSLSQWFHRQEESVAPSLSHWFHRQEESVALIRTLLQRPCFRAHLHTHILSLLSSSSQARQLAGAAICGGELIGLYEGCQGVFIPHGSEVTEKNCGSDLYEGRKKCVVLEIAPEHDVVRVRIAGEAEKKEVPFIAVDHTPLLPIRLNMLNPVIINKLLDMQSNFQEGEL